MVATKTQPPKLQHRVKFDQYNIPGRGIFPEGVVFDPATGQLFTASSGNGAIFRTTLDKQEFEVLSPAGANGCESILGLRMDHKAGRLFASASITGCAYVFDAKTGASLGRFTNGLAPKQLEAFGPGTTLPTLINDVAVVDDIAYFTDSYHPVLYRLTKETVEAANGGTGKLEPWLPFDGTVLKYSKGSSEHGSGYADFISGLNLNGIVATPDGEYLLVVQTNSGKIFRITIATKEIIEVTGTGNQFGDGMFAWDDKLIIIDMSLKQPITKLRLNNAFSRYEVIDKSSLPGNVSPTNVEIIDDRALITESQLVDVKFAKKPEHLPYRIISYPLSAIGE